MIKFCKIIKTILQLFINWEKGNLTKISKEEYLEIFIDKEKLERAYNKAWEVRDFEIDLYWRRATYFWTLQVPTFIGYFTIFYSSNFKVADLSQSTGLYFIICIGFLITLSWMLVNRGSKQWMRNWESHIDILETRYSGDLYKTIFMKRSFSVSRLNELVSCFFLSIWLVAGIKYWSDADLTLCFYGQCKFELFIFLPTVAVVLFTIAMIFGYGRGIFYRATYEIFQRQVIFKK